MAVVLGSFQADYESVDEFLHDPDGPVGRLILQLSERAKEVAEEVVHVFPGTPLSTVWSDESTANLPEGYTRDSIAVHLPRRGRRGGLYGGVNVAMLPAVFLEKRPKGSRQMYDRYPFMTTALDSLEGSI